MRQEIAKTILRSLGYFVVAAIFELGGGYLVWLWLKHDFAWPIGVLGGFLLFIYGVIPTAQSAHFYKVYSAYGGVFIIMSLMWGWVFLGIQPDRFDIIGTLVILVGVFFIFYHPKNNEQLWRA